MTTEPAAALDRRDAALACACALAALAAYLRTLAPGLTADVDAAVFQFLGRVLGVAHNPGYPLYALLTWPVAQIPAGSLAWRINVFSAVMGAVAVGATAIAARRLGCGRLAAAFAALGLAAGRIFWSQAIVAEVYTLHLVFVAMLLQSALRWEATRRPAHFYAAVAWLAVGLGHHTTIGAFAPALALHAILVDRRFALRLRTIAGSAGLCVLGLLPYAYVLIRSRDPQAYVESPATTFGALVQVVLGRQFRERVFTDPWTTLAAERLPGLVTDVLRPDLTIAGLLLAAGGAAWLLRRRPASAALLLVPSAIVTVFVAGYAVVDQPVFLLPVVLCLWLLAAFGLDRVMALVAARLPAPRVRAAAVAAIGVLALALPIGQAVAHGPRVDRSRDRADARHVEQLVAALPARAAIAAGDFIAERMVQYELLGRDAAAGRSIALAPRHAASIAALAADGVHVVGFPGAVDRLRLAGLDFSSTPVPLADATLDRVVAELPAGAIVGLAIPPAHARGLRPGTRQAWQVLGLAPDWGDGASASHVAVASVGAPAPPRALSLPGMAHLALGAHEPPWTGRAGIELIAEGGVAAIRAGGRDLLRTSDGVAVAIWLPDGALRRTFVLMPADGYQVPLEVNALSAYPLIGVAGAHAIAPGAADVDVTALAATGSITASVPAGGVLELEAQDDGAVVPHAPLHEGGPRFDVRPGPAGGSARVTIAADPSRPAAVHLVFGAIPDRLTAQLRGGGGPAQVRRAATDGLLRGPDRRSAVIRMTRDDQTLLLGTGWSAVELDDAGQYRWTTAGEARLVLPPSSPHWATLAIDAFRPGEGTASSVNVRLAGVALGARPVQPGWHSYTWTLPPEVAAALGRTPAELTLVVDGAEGARGLAVASLRFAEAR